MDIKKFKKEQENLKPLQKISQALSAQNEVMKKEVSTKKFLRKNMAKKMRAKDQVDLDLHNESENSKKGKKQNYK